MNSVYGCCKKKKKKGGGGAPCIFKDKHRAECESGELYFGIMWQNKCECRRRDDFWDIWCFFFLFSFNQTAKSHRRHLSILKLHHHHHHHCEWVKDVVVKANHKHVRQNQVDQNQRDGGGYGFTDWKIQIIITSNSLSIIFLNMITNLNLGRNAQIFCKVKLR